MFDVNGHQVRITPGYPTCNISQPPAKGIDFAIPLAQEPITA